MENNEIMFVLNNGSDELIIDGTEFDIVSYEGIESSDYQISTADNISNNGARVTKKRVSKRPISIEFDYIAIVGEDVIATTRKKLVSFFTPFSSGTLNVKLFGVERQIEYEVEKFKISSQRISEPTACLLELICPEPSMKTPYDIGNPIMTLIGGWKWKFTLPFKMKQYGPLKKNIYLGGDLETPVEIYFRGPAVNPKVVNHRTGEYIRVKRTLTTDETLYINTEYRKKVVKIISGNKTEDAWDSLEFGSKFFWLQPGDNMIEYSGEAEAEKSKGVEIHYRERYLGI